MTDVEHNELHARLMGAQDEKRGPKCDIRHIFEVCDDTPGAI